MLKSELQNCNVGEEKSPTPIIMVIIYSHKIELKLGILMKIIILIQGCTEPCYIYPMHIMLGI